MRRTLFLLSAMLVCVSLANAQDYKWGIGVKAGTGTTGLTVKHFFDGVNAIDGIISGSYRGGVSVHALYERHVPVIADGCRFYYGGGAHVYAWHNGTQLGIDGIVGLEYKIPAAPIALSIDFKPELNFIDKAGLYANTFFFGVKYAF